MKYYLYLLSLIILSCTPSEKAKSISDRFASLPVQEVTGELIIVKEDSSTYFNNMIDMSYVDDLLLINDNSHTHNLKVVNLLTKEMYKFGKRGRGPYEFYSPRTKTVVDYRSNAVYLGDWPKFFLFNIDSFKTKVAKIPIKTVKIDDAPEFIFSSTIVNGNIVGALDDQRFGIYNIDKKKFYRKLDYDQGTFLTNQSIFYPHPSDNKVVNLSLSSDNISIMSFNEQDFNFKELKGSIIRNQHELVRDGMKTYQEFSEDERLCFVSAAVTKKAIFCLYSGKLIHEDIDKNNILEKSFYSDVIYVFDWELNPIKTIKLEEKVRSIAIDKENKILYGATSVNNDPKLIKFNL